MTKAEFNDLYDSLCYGHDAELLISGNRVFFEQGLSKHGEAVFHYHEFSSPGVEHRGKAQPITPEIYEKYKKYFKGV